MLIRFLRHLLLPPILMVAVFVIDPQSACATDPAGFGLVTLPPPSSVVSYNQTWWWKWWNWKPQPKPTRSVPIPATLLPFGVGFLGLAVWRAARRRRRP